MTSTAKAEVFLDRVSQTLSSVDGKNRPSDYYKSAQTPNVGKDLPKATPYDAAKDENDLEGGALREGGAPNIWARENIGLIVNYACIGIVYGIFPRTVYPFLLRYLNMESYQTLAADMLVSLPWSFKTLIGIVTDSCPIKGYRRRPYIVFGWALCLVFVVIMAVLPVGDPYYKPGDIRKFDNASLRTIINKDAPGVGSKYIVLMMLASLGYVIADVACDAVMVEFAQREPLEVRGNTQTMMYFSRFIFSTIACAIVGVFFNGEEYGGTFSFSLSFNQLMIFVAIGAACGVPAAFFIPDKPVKGESFIARCREMAYIATHRAIWQIMAFNFFNALLFDFSASCASQVQSKWAKVVPFTESMFTVLSYTLLSIGIYITKLYFLNMSWRKVIFYMTLIYVAIDGVVTFTTIFDGIRSQWFWLGAPVLSNIPQGIRFIISGLVTVEIAEEGYEGATYGLMTTIHNLAAPFSGAISNQVGAHFDAYEKDIESDTNHVRWQVAYIFIIMYAMKLISNVFLFLLPDQKQQAQELKQRGGRSVLAASIAFAIALFALVWGITINLLSVFPSTACLKIAGGQGCDN